MVCQVVELDRLGEGWAIRVMVDQRTAYVHLTAEWLDEIYKHQIRPRQAKRPGTSQTIPVEGEAAFNRLRHLLRTNSEDSDLIAAEFAEAYGAIIKNRVDRRNLGMKATTRDGDEDLRAVQAGAPVRSWNSTGTKPELHDWIKQQRGKRADR